MSKVASVKEYIECLEKNRKKENISMLFRGQSNASWSIESTLERVGIKNIRLKDYYESIDYFKSEINSLGYHFQRKLNEKGYDFDFSDWINISLNKFPDIEYLSYLRHHGFPTPLIDVTQSEYIALFFACEDLDEKTDAKIFAIETDLGNTRVSGNPELHRIGHYLESDQRHIVQQSEYLLPVQFQKKEYNSEWYFVPFSSFWKKEKTCMNEDEQKLIFEIVIDGAAKKEIMAELAKMNINHYTLYLDEDSLIRKLKCEFLQRAEILRDSP